MGRDFKNIKAWQLANELALEVYKKTIHFPKSEIYGLTSQMRRAAVSVAANISEGSNRGSQKDYLRFLNIAKGSLAETEYLIYLSNKLDYLKNESFLKLSDVCVECSKTLLGLIRCIEKDIYNN